MEYKQEHEKELVTLASHDKEAFAVLYKQYFPRVFAYIGYRVGRNQDVEDLTAETFLRVVEGLKNFSWRHEASFAAWVFRIAHNLIQDRYRSAKFDYGLTLEELPEISDSALLPEEMMLRKEQFAFLRKLIGTLPPRRQEVLILKFFAGLRNQEIATILNLHETTVAAYLCRSIDDLQFKYASGTQVERRNGYVKLKSLPVRPTTSGGN